jgi:protein-S-isoprenylcysteine O-methyltransferase Ste14
LTGSSRDISTKVSEEKSTDRWILPIMGRLIYYAGIAASVLDIEVLRQGRFTFDLIAILGVALFIAGLGLYLISRLTLGRFYSETVRIMPEHKLITRGPYRIIRHPIYLGEILIFISIPVILGSIFGFVIMLLLIPMILLRIRIEEKVLHSKFGEEYDEYASRTKKLVPCVY